MGGFSAPPGGQPPFSGDAQHSGTTGGSHFALGTKKESAYGQRVQYTAVVTVTTHGTPVRAPQFRIPSGAEVEARPRSSNAGAIFIGSGNNSPRVSAGVAAQGALMLNKADVPPLVQVIQNLSELQVDADNDGDIVTFLVKW